MPAEDKNEKKDRGKENRNLPLRHLGRPEVGENKTIWMH